MFQRNAACSAYIARPVEIRSLSQASVPGIDASHSLSCPRRRAGA